jgi:hypothetical protein
MRLEQQQCSRAAAEANANCDSYSDRDCNGSSNSDAFD